MIAEYSLLADRKGDVENGLPAVLAQLARTMDARNNPAIARLFIGFHPPSQTAPPR
jgi:hypothetical protein